MSTENAAVANSIAAAGKRLESMSLLCEMLAGHVTRQRRELQTIQSALAGPAPGHKQSSQGAPGDISPEMLA